MPTRLSYKFRGGDAPCGSSPSRGTSGGWRDKGKRAGSRVGKRGEKMSRGRETITGSSVFRHVSTTSASVPEKTEPASARDVGNFYGWKPVDQRWICNAAGPNCFCVVLKKRERGKKGGREKSTIYIGQFRSRRAARTKLSEKYRRVNNTLIS